jgi:DNA-binding CsgD family transcriptional regulator
MDDPSLSVYEVWLIRHVSKGATMQQIAAANGMTRGGVTRCMSRLRAKVRVRNNPHLVAWAYENGVLP